MMLQRCLRASRLLGARASMPAARMTLCRLYSDSIGSNSLPNSKSKTARDKRTLEDLKQTLTQTDSISSVIRDDHQEIQRYYEKIVKASDPDEQRRFQNAFVWELTRHAIAEELVVYPAIETGVTDGKIMADKDRAEHQVTKDQLYKFQRMSPGGADFIPALEALMKDLKIHIQEEEEHDLVKLEEALLSTRSKALAEQFELTKAFTPTRSHPSAPNKPPYETAVGLMTAPIDRLRDIFRSWPDEPSRKPPSGGPAR
ncbi:hypothetical protein GGR52DRAFT_482339 [Hypoxylon sp. FL1284]|nr:hypothetical protein GGR52DRAFT_482339 [Hypoxylon sp. FL1284]